MVQRVDVISTVRNCETAHPWLTYTKVLKPIVMQAASASAQSSLKAPSSLAVGAAMPSTKDSILAQSGSSQHPDSSYPPKAPSSSTPPAAATAAASKSSKATAVSQPRESEMPKRSLKGFEEAVVQSVTALCQVSCQFVSDVLIVKTAAGTNLHSLHCVHNCQ